MLKKQQIFNIATNLCIKIRFFYTRYYGYTSPKMDRITQPKAAQLLTAVRLFLRTQIRLYTHKKRL